MMLGIELINDENEDFNEDFNTDSEYSTDSESELEIEIEEEEIEEVDGNMLLDPNRCFLLLCELYYTKLHGFDAWSDPAVLGHYLVIHTIDPESIQLTKNKFGRINNKYARAFASILRVHRNVYRIMDLENMGPHSFIKNYSNIIANPNYISPQIGQIIYLTGGECVTIIKTVWIKIIQRKWKSVFKQRTFICKERCKLSYIKFWEINGKWPSGLNNLPSIVGMLSNLKLNEIKLN